MGAAEASEVVEFLRSQRECEWAVAEHTASPTAQQPEDGPITWQAVERAEQTLERFATYFKIKYPDTRANNGLIESPLVRATPQLVDWMTRTGNHAPLGSVYLKLDNELPISGSVKARGGIYEVISHTEQLLQENFSFAGTPEEMQRLADGAFAAFLKRHTIVVGSTGNLGLSIGIVAGDLGFNVEVHMSEDAQEWKKQLLRSKGVNVIEHAGDYTVAVQDGRRRALEDPNAYFIDDEDSALLFAGYATAAGRLRGQILAELGGKLPNRVNVWIPCGIGGAAGGVSFGLRHVFGDIAGSVDGTGSAKDASSVEGSGFTDGSGAGNTASDSFANCTVRAFWVEPVSCPSMMIESIVREEPQLAELLSQVRLSNRTVADGLAVTSASRLVAPYINTLCAGLMTVTDVHMLEGVRALHEHQNVKIEPSAAAGLLGPTRFECAEGDMNIIWLTGGSLLPDDVYRHYLDAA